MTAPTYEELVRELFPRLTGGIRWGVERTAGLLAAVGDPHRRFRVLHVGGTNGKGSVAATLASVLRQGGLRCGLYTSPHLCSFAERVQVDGRPVAEEALVTAARRLWPLIRREEPSFFEATTAIAFLALAEAEVDAAVVEVGLGGRLDATNVVAPEIAVLTNVALDHAEYLGTTLDAIAREKAGIIKAGVPVASAETDPAIREIFRARAEEVGAPFFALAPGAPEEVRVGPGGTRFRLATRAWGELELQTPLIGAHQARNAALAALALSLLPEELRPDRDALVRGMARVVWPGRLQCERIDGQDWIFDVAHNPAGVASLVEALRLLAVPRPLVALVGILGDKEWSGMLPPLAALADAMILTVPPTAPPHRRWDPAQAAARLGGEAVAVADFDRALAEARRRAAGGSVLVTGSVHTVGDALTLLGFAPWQEPLAAAGLPALAPGL